MTKKLIALITVGCLIGAIALTVGICAIIANSKNDKSTPDASLSKWQSYIKDDALLKNIVIPGAHDAGTKGLPYFSATQDRDTADLLKCGTRYFDLRVSYANGKLLIYHGPSKGVALSDVLEQVSDFLKIQTSETVILDFQHFEETDNLSQNGALQLLEEKLANMLVVNDSQKTDVEFTDTLTLGQTRGKCFVVWGRQTEEILAKNYVFKRNNDDGTRDNSVLHSYYQSSLNKKSSKKYVEQALPQYLEKYGKESKGLFVLQGQLTDGLFVFGPRFRESTHTKRMNKYVENLHNDENLSLINIIMRDFVSPEKNCLALKLNITKGLVLQDKLNEYERMTDSYKG